MVKLVVLYGPPSSRVRGAAAHPRSAWSIAPGHAAPCGATAAGVGTSCAAAATAAAESADLTDLSAVAGARDENQQRIEASGVPMSRGGGRCVASHDCVACRRNGARRRLAKRKRFRLSPSKRRTRVRRYSTPVLAAGHLLSTGFPGLSLHGAVSPTSSSWNQEFWLLSAQRPANT